MGVACQQRMLTPPDTWSCPTLDLASVLMLRPISPEFVLFPDFWVSNIPWHFCFAQNVWQRFFPCLVFIIVNTIETNLWSVCWSNLVHGSKVMVKVKIDSRQHMLTTTSFVKSFDLGHYKYWNSVFHALVWKFHCMYQLAVHSLICLFVCKFKHYTVMSFDLHFKYLLLLIINNHFIHMLN